MSYQQKKLNEKWFLATAQWQKEIGLKKVILDKEFIKSGLKNCIGVERNILGTLRPTLTSEIQDIVRIGQKFKTPLYTISCGNNWGYGSKNPVVESSFLVDLSNMNRIKEFDEKAGTITLEPGVTQQQLYDFLKNKSTKYMVPTTGAGPNASILGNAIERGYGLAPHSDHFEAVTSLKAVLPNGQIYQPALEELGGNKINNVFKWGIGPYLDGLFSQGNFGIVTEITILLEKKPEVISTFFFSIENQDKLGDAICAIQKVKSDLGSNIGPINLMNDRRILSMVEPYDNDYELDQGIISQSTIKQLRKKHHITEWTGFGVIYSRPEIARGIKKVLSKELKPYLKKLVFFTEKKLNFLKKVNRFLPQKIQQELKPKLNCLENGFKNVSGVPNQVALPLAYYKSNKEPSSKLSMNPAADQCGLIWHSPLIPLNKKDIVNHIEIINEICPQFSLEPLITLTVLSDNCVDSTIPLLFDRSNPDEVINAQRCHQRLFSKEAAQGYLPYRVGVNQMNEILQQDSVAFQLAQKIKLAIDPNQILSPGRYVPYNSIHQPSSHIERKKLTQQQH